MQDSPLVDTGSKAVIIIGMHRSGTSLIANWLNKCGLNIGEELLEGATGNIDGHFEDIDFYNLHIDILKKCGLADSGMIINDNRPLQVGPDSYRKMNALIDKKKTKNKIWAWKDPRTCLFLDTYRKLLPNAFQLIIIRDYESVVISLLNRAFADEFEKPKKRTGFAGIAWRLFRRKYKLRKFCVAYTELFLGVWIYYNKKILDNIQQNSAGKYLVIDYKLLKTNSAQVISYFNKNWSLSLKNFDFDRVYKKELMSKKFNLCPFIKDQDLKQCADKIQQQLKSYIGIDSSINKLSA